MQTNNQITGIILAGGKSSRFGTDKAFAELNGMPLISFSYNKLKQICSKIILSSNSENSIFLDIKIVKDEFAEIGPIGGIYSALNQSDTEINIVLSCDIPFVSVDLLNYLLLQSENFDVTIAKHEDYCEPLIGIYKKSINNSIKDSINNKQYSLIKLITKLNYNEVIINEKQNFYHNNLFFNVNTKQDLEKLKNLPDFKNLADLK